METVKTYCPLFSGFYNSYYEPDLDNELDYINEQREELGLEEINSDELDCDYEQYYIDCAKVINDVIFKKLNEFVSISGYEYDRLVSPREYNFTNDSIDVTVCLSDDNMGEIMQYVVDNWNNFKDYISERYTSRSGFISFHSHDAGLFLIENGNPLLDVHKLGSILNFILLNEGVTELYDVYDSVAGQVTLNILNYNELVPETI